MNNITTGTPNPGPADIFCLKCGRYHASVTCCPPPDHVRCRTVPAAATVVADELFTLRDHIKRLEADHNRLKDLLEDVATSGVEDVKGLRYLTVQIYRDVWAKIQAELEKAGRG